MWWFHLKNKFTCGGLIQKISSYAMVSWFHPKNKFICGGLIRKISMYLDSSSPYVRLLLGSVLVSSDFQYFH